MKNKKLHHMPHYSQLKNLHEPLDLSKCNTMQLHTTLKQSEWSSSLQQSYSTQPGFRNQQFWHIYEEKQTSYKTAVNHNQIIYSPMTCLGHNRSSSRSGVYQVSNSKECRNQLHQFYKNKTKQSQLTWNPHPRWMPTKAETCQTRTKQGICSS